MGKSTEMKRFLVLSVMIVILLPEAALSKSSSAIGIEGNIGFMVAFDEDSYWGEGVDLYPEVGLWIEVPYLRIGSTLGIIYRQLEYSSWGVYGSYGYEENIVVLPVVARLDFRPFSESDLLVSPYLGGGIGTYLAVDGPHESSIAVSARAGLEILVDYATIFGDIRIEPTIGSDSQLGGVMITSGAILKLPF